VTETHYRRVTVDGQSLFYREAGDDSAPVVLLLHGCPSSSHMFRDLIPLLAERYHVIAPDLLGFGNSDMPSVDDFAYTFQALTVLSSGLLTALSIDSFTMYVQDYGGPIGWRLALLHPHRVTAIVSQNGNAYEEGLPADHWAAMRAYWKADTPETEAAMRESLTLDHTKGHYYEGEDDASLISPDAWQSDQQFLDRRGNDLVQLRLFRDYGSNVELYPVFQEYFRTSQVPLLAVWGANDRSFGPAGALAFARDLPGAEIHLIHAGHFALETHLGEIAERMIDFLGRVVTTH